MQTSSSGGSGAAIAILLIVAAVGITSWVVILAGMWKVFTKAGRQGWEAIVPVWNAITLCTIARRPGWWVLLFCIPLVNVVFAFIVYVDLARAFGKGTGFGVLMVFFPFVMIPVLGFGSATYQQAPPAYLPPPPIGN